MVSKHKSFSNSSTGGFYSNACPACETTFTGTSDLFIAGQKAVGSVSTVGWVQNTLLSPIFKVALMEVPMGTQSTHTKFGAPRPHQFFGAGPQSFTT